MEKQTGENRLTGLCGMGRSSYDKNCLRCSLSYSSAAQNTELKTRNQSAGRDGLCLTIILNAKKKQKQNKQTLTCTTTRLPSVSAQPKQVGLHPGQVQTKFVAQTHSTFLNKQANKTTQQDEFNDLLKCNQVNLFL